MAIPDWLNGTLCPTFGNSKAIIKLNQNKPPEGNMNSYEFIWFGDELLDVAAPYKHSRGVFPVPTTSVSVPTSKALCVRNGWCSKNVVPTMPFVPVYDVLISRVFCTSGILHIVL